MTEDSGIDGTSDVRSVPSLASLALALALNAAAGGAPSLGMSAITFSGVDETTSLQEPVARVTDGDLLQALARVHQDLLGNATMLDAELQEVIDSHLWDLYGS